MKLQAAKQNQKSEMRTAVIVAHKFLTQPDDELVLYLNGLKVEKVLHICHSFSDARDRRSFYCLYQDGELVEQRQTDDYSSWPEPLIYLKEMFFTAQWAIQKGGRWDIYVGMDGLCVLCGNLLRALRRARRTVYWAMDFVPENRFKSTMKNMIYAAINKNGYLHADEVWDLSPRMTEARDRFGGIKPSDYRRHLVVPYGVWLNRIPHFSYDECEQHTLVFMGHLLEKQGVQLVIRAMPPILERIPELQFKIIGEGSYRPALEDLADKMGVAEHCVFFGKIPNIEQLELEVAKSAVAIAPYIRALDTWTIYADPGKVKTYLACGVPVLLTDLPWNAGDIERYGCGKVISEDVQDIVENIVRVMDKERNQSMRDKALQFAKGFEWPGIFKAALMNEVTTTEPVPSK